MQLDPETSTARRYEKIAALSVQRETLLKGLKTARNTEKWRLQALLVTTERALRWQLARVEPAKSAKIPNPPRIPRPRGRPRKRPQAENGPIA